MLIPGAVFLSATFTRCTIIPGADQKGTTPSRRWPTRRARGTPVAKRECCIFSRCVNYHCRSSPKSTTPSRRWRGKRARRTGSCCRRRWTPSTRSCSSCRSGSTTSRPTTRPRTRATSSSGEDDHCPAPLLSPPPPPHPTHTIFFLLILFLSDGSGDVRVSCLTAVRTHGYKM